MCKTNNKSYLKDGAKLIALVSHLATIDKRVETIDEIAEDTSLNISDVSYLIHTYNELFVEVHPSIIRPISGDDDYYTLHLRLGLSRSDIDDFAPLSSNHISILINTIQHAMDIEHQQRSSSIKNWITMIAAIIAAIAAIIAAALH